MDKATETRARRKDLSERSQKLWQVSRELRRCSHELSCEVQSLCVESQRLRCDAAMLKEQLRAYHRKATA
jgi:hypothetical protein